MGESDYEDGVRDGKLDALISEVRECKKNTNARFDSTDDRFESYENSQKTQQKILWMLVGGVFLVQALPSLKGLLQ